MRYDLLLDEENEAVISHGDFVLGSSDQQHVQHIVEAFKGDFKSSPLVGFGVLTYLKRDSKVESEFLRDLKIQLENDGYLDTRINISEGFKNLQIEI